MNLQESGEMYLEAILVLSEKRSAVRSVDVADYFGYSKPSISRAVGLLKNGGFITVSDDGSLTLTEVGREVADKIYQRHRVLTALLVRLGVDESVASEDACKMEHHISDVTFDAIKRYLETAG